MGLLPGSCLCGEVRFEVEPPFLGAGHCHCSRCRKHSGTAVCTQARFPRERFRLIAGTDFIRVYGKGGGAVFRPQFHTFVDSRAPWDEIHDGLSQYAGRKTD